MDGSFDVVIAGGGIAGLSAAIAIGRCGFSVCVLERERKPSEAGAGIQLGPNAVKVLQALGLGEQLAAYAVPTQCIHVRDGLEGGTLIAIPLGKAAETRYGAPYFVIHRRDLHNMLHERASVMPKIDIRFGHDVERCAEHAGGVDVGTSDKTGVGGKILAGADGLWSRVREFVLADGAPDATGKMAWRGMIARADAPRIFHASVTGLWLMPGAHLVHYPVRGGDEINVVAITEGDIETRGWSQPGEASRLLESFHDTIPDLSKLLTRVDTWRTWPLYDRPPAKRYTSGRMVLLGDAAHPSLPYLAQGGAMAIEDGYVLARCLKHHGAVEEALRHFDALRVERTGRIQKASRRQLDAYHAVGSIRMARNIMLRAANRIAPHKALARYDWIWGHDVTQNT